MPFKQSKRHYLTIVIKQKSPVQTIRSYQNQYKSFEAPVSLYTPQIFTSHNQFGALKRAIPVLFFTSIDPMQMRLRINSRNLFCSYLSLREGLALPHFESSDKQVPYFVVHYVMVDWKFHTLG